MPCRSAAPRGDHNTHLRIPDVLLPISSRPALFACAVRRRGNDSSGNRTGGSAAGCVCQRPVRAARHLGRAGGGTAACPARALDHLRQGRPRGGHALLIRHPGATLRNSPTTARWAVRTAAVGEAILLGLLGATLLWAPLPLGSNRLWASGLLAAVLLSTLLALLLLQWVFPFSALRARHAPSAPLHRSAWFPLGLLGAYAAIVASQLFPVADALRPLLVPEPDGAALVSVEPFATRHYLLKTLGYAAAFMLVLMLMTTALRMKALLLVLLLSGVAQTALAVAFYNAPAGFVYLFNDVVPGSRARGTFANPDHLAGYMALCFAAGLGLILAQAGGGGPDARGWRQGLAELLRFIHSAKMLVRLLLVVVVICLVMTHSRMGNAAFFISLIAVGVLCALRSRALRKTAIWLVLSVMTVDLVVIGQWVGMDRVIERLSATPAIAESASPSGEAEPPRWREEALDERLRAARAALGMLAARPLSGFGGGTFHVAFPPFKSSEHRLGFYDHAHNDYVELAADTGLPGLLLLVLLVAATAWRALVLLGRDDDPLARGVAAGVLMAICCLGLHSLVDFNLQIPSNALTFTVLLALPWCLPLHQTSARRLRPRWPTDDRHPLPHIARRGRRPAES